jgi:hypothetical protein
MLHFANDVVLLQENEDSSQKSMNELRKLSTIYNFKISAIKTEVTAFRLECSIVSKITNANESITEKAFDFDYIIIIIIIVIIMALQSFGWPWPLFQFLDPIHRQ